MECPLYSLALFLDSVYNEDLDMVMGFWKTIHAPAIPDSEEEANHEPLIIDFRALHSPYSKRSFSQANIIP